MRGTFTITWVVWLAATMIALATGFDMTWLNLVLIGATFAVVAGRAAAAGTLELAGVALVVSVATLVSVSCLVALLSPGQQAADATYALVFGALALAAARALPTDGRSPQRKGRDEENRARHRRLRLSSARRSSTS